MAVDSPSGAKPAFNRDLVWSICDQHKDEGNQLFKVQKYAEALEKYNEAITESEDPNIPEDEVNPNLKVYLSNRSFCHIRMENFGSAIMDAGEAVELDDKFTKAYYRRGCAYLGLAKYAEAAKDFRKAAELDPKDRVIRGQLVECKKQIKMIAFAEAMKDDRTASASDEIDLDQMTIPESYTGPRYEPEKGQEALVKLKKNLENISGT